ncbi:MAG: hypothetical protein HN736_02585 [Anaerolineae bacterium]|jgi:hypothetical protein|nr:hypothetical protein [Anaerolineae bacterium]MBT3712931.1 hypothetical protein [Anaerolineae bacterium]MBT4309976.1 hypothetical protein [Anaerolineae bacterium]MBT4457042.1 hypothetical protein [Anaerolineae bacterium]MBT6059719.1 hypothetical protein [Anaerolineae bacterium]
MKNLNFWQRWLFIFSLIIVVFGLFMAFFNRTALLIALFDNQINPVFWEGNSLLPNVEQFLGFIYGILGATMARWVSSSRLSSRTLFVTKNAGHGTHLSWLFRSGTSPTQPFHYRLA